MADAMKPTDVPYELVRTAAEVLRQNGLWGGWEQEQAEEEVRKILGAALPLYEQQVREGIALDLKRRSNKLGQDAVRRADRHSPLAAAKSDALWTAACQIEAGRNGGDDA